MNRLSRRRFVYAATAFVATAAAVSAATLPRLTRAQDAAAPAASQASAQTAAAPRAKHVFIISFDGGKPSVMQKSRMPVLNDVIKQGAHTWSARTTFPSITLTSHTSMLTGVGPGKHKVLWNTWKPENGMVPVPTIFKLAKADKTRKLKTAMFVGKAKFIHLFTEDAVDEFSFPAYDCKAVSRAAAEHIAREKPNLCFIHFADSDGAGHEFGWGSPEQIKAFADEDDALNVVKKAIEKAGIARESVIILSADHGGHAKTHGTASDDDMTIPWVAWGATVKPGYTITAPVTTYDTSATALWLLGVPVPDTFDGKPVTDAFTTDAAAK